MREDICTIPISEVFVRPRENPFAACGYPENRVTEYITGAAW